MNQNSEETLLEFPCEFPIKAMGSDLDGFETLVVSLVQKHCNEVSRVHSRASKNGNFISVTVTITASSKQQIDSIYYELTGHESVLMAL